MKYHLFIFTFIVLGLLSIFPVDAQDPFYQYEAHYQFEFEPPEGMDAPAGVENLVENVKKVPILLRFNNDQSHYFVDFYPTNFEESITGISVRRTMEFFRDRSGSLIWKYLRMGRTSYVHEPLKIDWEIDPHKTTSINGIECLWAKGKFSSGYFGDFDIFAWFTTEIPVPFGPFGIGGLPGLITQLQFKSDTFTLTKIKNIADDKIRISWPENTISMGKYLGEAEDDASDFMENFDRDSREKIQNETELDKN